MNLSQICNVLAQLAEQNQLFAQLQRQFLFLKYVDFINSLDKPEIQAEVQTVKKRLTTLKPLAEQLNMSEKFNLIEESFEIILNSAPAERERQKRDVVSKLFGPNEQTGQDQLDLFDSGASSDPFIKQQIEGAKGAFTTQLDKVHSAIRKMCVDLENHERQQAEQYSQKLSYLYNGWDADANGVEGRLRDCDSANEAVQARTLVLKKHFTEQFAALSERNAKVRQTLSAELEYFGLTSQIDSAVNSVMLLARKVDTLNAALTDGQECLQRLKATREMQENSDKIIQDIYEKLGIKQY